MSWLLGVQLHSLLSKASGDGQEAFYLCENPTTGASRFLSNINTLTSWLLGIQLLPVSLSEMLFNYYAISLHGERGILCHNVHQMC